MAPGQQPAVKIAVRNNHRTRALSGTVLYWRASLSAEETARVKRDLARENQSRDTETLDQNSRLLCKTAQRHADNLVCPERHLPAHRAPAQLGTTTTRYSAIPASTATGPRRVDSTSYAAPAAAEEGHVYGG
jgi:hypothetical protein